jgi:hypothetical protein
VSVLISDTLIIQIALLQLVGKNIRLEKPAISTFLTLKAGVVFSAISLRHWYH